MLFDDDLMDDAHAKELLADILDDGQAVRRSYSPATPYGSNSLARWETFREELMQRNRFFPDTMPNLSLLAQLLQWIRLRQPGLQTRWYRARIQNSTRPFPLDEMGAPPANVISHGRANPAGIPYLYLASEAQTAVTEIRPHTGDYVTVASFDIPDSLAILDLRSPRRTASPFEMGDEAPVFLAECGFLERLGEELTRPVLPRSAAIDYLPSQYVCEFAKKMKFDGVMYRSASGNESNLALFAPDIVTAVSASRYRVSRVSITLE